MSARIRRYLYPISGFSLIEMLVVTMIIALLVSIAVPTMRAYFERTRVASAISAGRTVQASLASAATTSEDNAYPETIDNYTELATLVNANGGQLKDTEEEMGVQLQLYTPIDTVGDGIWDSYTMSWRVTDVSKRRPGWCLTIEPSGVVRCPAE